MLKVVSLWKKFQIDCLDRSGYVYDLESFRKEKNSWYLKLSSDNLVNCSNGKRVKLAQQYKQFIEFGLKTTQKLLTRS